MRWRKVRKAVRGRSRRRRPIEASTGSDQYMRVRATEVFYDAAKEAVSRQLSQIDSLDTKSATIFASASTILAIIAAVLQFVSQSVAQNANQSIDSWVR